jgi:hypothetical protein
LLRRYFQDILEKLPSPQHAIYGWSGLVMSDIMYNLRVPGVPYIIPGNPADYSPATTPGTVGCRTRVAAAAATGAAGTGGAGAAGAAPTSLTHEEKATTDAEFTLVKKYWLLYQNIL